MKRDDALAPIDSEPVAPTAKTQKNTEDFQPAVSTPIDGNLKDGCCLQGGGHPPEHLSTSDNPGSTNKGEPTNGRKHTRLRGRAPGAGRTQPDASDRAPLRSYGLDRNSTLRQRRDDAGKYIILQQPRCSGCRENYIPATSLPLFLLPGS